MNWVYQLENEIFTVISHRATKALKTKYPNIFFTQDAEPDDTTSHFPTVFLRFMPMAEVGNDLDNISINAVMSAIQIEVTCSKDQKQSGARQVMWAIIDEFKKLRYNVAMTPEVLNTGNDTHQVIARVRRVIGQGENIK